jgi:hypothetical protein
MVEYHTAFHLLSIPNNSNIKFNKESSNKESGEIPFSIAVVICSSYCHNSGFPFFNSSYLFLAFSFFFANSLESITCEIDNVCHTSISKGFLVLESTNSQLTPNLSYVTQFTFTEVTVSGKDQP